MKVLLAAADDESLGRTASQLQQEGFTVVEARDSNRAVDRWRQEEPDLVVLDVKLPPADGFDVCQRIRQTSRVPVIMLASAANEEDVVRGFTVGADDYLTRPFGASQLAVRIRAVYNRYAQLLASRRETNLRIGTLVLNVETHQLGQGDTTVLLTPIEFRIFSVLATNEGMVVSFSRLIEYAWTHKTYNKANLDALKTHVTHLRHKLRDLGGQPSDIAVVPRSGYFLPRSRR
jgi:DNA-binding response OmpR family regulator